MKKDLKIPTNWESKFWNIVEEKGNGADIRFVQQLRDFIKANFIEKQEAKERLEKYKCDFNWDFKKNKARHKSYIALDEVIRILFEE